MSKWLSMKKRFILVHGPTGVGKSDTITAIGQSASIEIVNCDIGQFYEPMAIGTAKPDWKNEPIPHHLFDLITEPKDFSVTHYRTLIQKKMEEIWQRGNTPVLVGGSGFYGKSLFFPPRGKPAEWNKTVEGSWEDLVKIDPERAASIHKNDTYRIQRALSMIQHHDTKPSDYQPHFEPLPGDCLVIFLTRDRKQLYQRINERTKIMFKQGWVKEVEKLIGTPWENFLERKKLIGYTEIMQYLKDTDKSNEAQENVMTLIAQKTRNYAKRQETFWRMFKKLLIPVFKGSHSKVLEVNLTDDANAQGVKEGLKQFLS